MTANLTAGQTVTYTGSMAALHGRTYTITRIDGGRLTLKDASPSGCYCEDKHDSRAWSRNSCISCGNHLIGVRPASVTAA